MVKLSPFKLARMKAGLRQIDIARMLDVSESLVACWETGRLRPRKHHLDRLTVLLNATPEELFPEVFSNETPREC